MCEFCNQFPSSRSNEQYSQSTSTVPVSRVWNMVVDLRTSDQKIAQLQRDVKRLDQDVHEIRNILQALVLKVGLE